jgi:hypothetical protein
MRGQSWTLDKVPFLRLISQSLGGRLKMKGQWLVFTEIDTSSAYKFAFPTDTASAQSIIHGQTQCLIYPLGIASAWGPPFPANECGNDPCSWIHHLTYSSLYIFWTSFYFFTVILFICFNFILSFLNLLTCVYFIWATTPHPTPHHHDYWNVHLKI